MSLQFQYLTPESMKEIGTAVSLSDVESFFLSDIAVAWFLKRYKGDGYCEVPEFDAAVRGIFEESLARFHEWRAQKDKEVRGGADD